MELLKKIECMDPKNYCTTFLREHSDLINKINELVKEHNQIVDCIKAIDEWSIKMQLRIEKLEKPPFLYGNKGFQEQLDRVRGAKEPEMPPGSVTDVFDEIMEIFIKYRVKSVEALKRNAFIGWRDGNFTVYGFKINPKGENEK
jgi:hypothetical protein